MSKRHSKGLNFFCFPEELQGVLDPVLARSGARLCVAEERNERWYFREVSSLSDSKANYPKFYICHPAMIGTKGLDSLANIVQVRAPVREDGRLRMGEIGMLITESELSEEHRQFGADIYRNSRKVLTKSFRRGVLGRNSKTGGEHFYKDILISERAGRAYRDGGIVLATLMGDGFITYHVDAG